MRNIFLFIWQVLAAFTLNPINTNGIKTYKTYAKRADEAHVNQLLFHNLWNL